MKMYTQPSAVLSQLRGQMANQWFRMYAEFATDPKVQMMSETFQRRLMMLFCLRCNGNETFHDEEVMFQLRISPEEWQATKAEFIAKKFIGEDNKILNWDKRQYRSDSSTERVRKYRETKKQGDETPCNVSVTPPDTEQNTDTETDIKNNNYVFPFSGEAFNGQVIQLDSKAFNIWFQRYSFGDEHKFREMIAKRDEWYAKQPYNTYRDEKWLHQTTRWLVKNCSKNPKGTADFKSLASYV